MSVNFIKIFLLLVIVSNKVSAQSFSGGSYWISLGVTGFVLLLVIIGFAICFLKVCYFKKKQSIMPTCHRIPDVYTTPTATTINSTYVPTIYEEDQPPKYETLIAQQLQQQQQQQSSVDLNK